MDLSRDGRTILLQTEEREVAENDAISCIQLSVVLTIIANDGFHHPPLGTFPCSKRSFCFFLYALQKSPDLFNFAVREIRET
jgi:hypothetical protein